ncbi:hypothetical protein FHS43_004836 [Streptosporangium becharense]|uniref:DUF3107 domain-containing protein n=1 Tax=Streptosporangium becharense TaxID=1816182 RepID=A0A7W9II63_9ACTN|nr:DUF3107 domain-containing protein [Streptosporangium becharense]MBB2913532.1 hypothetical protein [Streptosporangium becharense]MBB5821222.1 hypothetical protein [Streptosporangium becharense]
MEIKIGVRSVHRELIVETDLTAEEIENALGAALSSNTGVFTIDDANGRRIIVPTASLGFIEIGEEEPRAVGFGGTL